VQRAPAGIEIPGSFFAETLELSSDRKVHADQFDLKKAKERLLATHLFEKAEIKIISAHTLLIDYELKRPLACLGNLESTLIDATGRFFPEYPFYPTPHYPRVWVAERGEMHWGESLDSEALKIVKEVSERMDVKEIDLSRIEAASRGRREIILSLASGIKLRLTARNYRQEIENYFRLADLILNCRWIDMRIPSIALLEKNER
jgi:hypothetical protein